MREIKFRGYNAKNQQWLYGFYLQNRGRHFVCPDEFANGKSWEDYEAIPETVGQFTGLLDKNGKEIYEGDILKSCFDDEEEPVVFDVIFERGAFKRHHGDITTCLEPTHLFYEIIGNIHDNPELIKGGEK